MVAPFALSVRSAFLAPILPRRIPCLSFAVSGNSRTRPFVCASREVSTDGVRVNKCFKARFSRRQADLFVDSGRVSINGERAFPGARVWPGDVVSLDGSTVDWERLALGEEQGTFAYLKFHKPTHVVTTTDEMVENNIISALMDGGYTGRDRVFPVGRLDEQTSGIILCTSDGSLVNAALGGDSNCEKVYTVRTDMRVADDELETLREGVVIKTVAQYARGRKPFVAPTRPCKVERLVTDPDDMRLRITLTEGRNRQIRKMLGVLGYTVREIHRQSFMGIGLDGCEEAGSWAALNANEMSIVRACIERKRASEKGSIA